METDRIFKFRLLAYIVGSLIFFTSIWSIRLSLDLHMDSLNLGHRIRESASSRRPISSDFKLVLLDVDLLREYAGKFDTTIDGGTEKNQLVSLGVFEWDRENFENWINDVDGRNTSTMVLVKTIGKDYRRMHRVESKSRNVNTTTHYFLIGPRRIMHVAVVFPRNGFYWIANVKESRAIKPDFVSLSKKPIGIPTPMAVDRFDCVPFDRSNASKLRSIFSKVHPIPLDRLCVPSDLEYYIWQIPNSNFRECHYDDIVFPFKREHTLKALEDLSDYGRGLREVMNVSRRLRIPTMIICGTLLGWFRQCDHIVQSKDIDVAVQRDQFESSNLIGELFRSDIINVYSRFGHPKTGVEYRTYAWPLVHVRGQQPIWIDVFGLYRFDRNRLAIFMHTKTGVFAELFPLLHDGICSAELYDVLVYLPCNYADYIVADFGYDGWFVPIKGKYYPNINFKRVHNFTKGENFTHALHVFKKPTNSCETPSILWGCDTPSEGADHWTPEVWTNWNRSDA